MKKELRKLTKAGVMLCAAVSFSSSHAEGRSKDGAQSATGHGRTVISLEDLKALLGSRDPSSQSSLFDDRQKQEVSDGILSLKLALSESERAVLVGKIADIERRRAALIAQLDRDQHKKKEDLKNDRKSIQGQRMNSSSTNDRALSQRLFSSLVKESNIHASRDRALQNFAKENAFVFEFESAEGLRWVHSISVGSRIVWRNGRKKQLARK